MDLALMRVLRKMGWTREQFFSLPESEQEDHLAMDLHIHRQMGQALQGMDARIKADKAVDGGAYASLWIAYMGG